MRYYTPTIFSILSPAAVIYYLLMCSGLIVTGEDIIGILPNAVTDIFGGKSELLELFYGFCYIFLLFQLAMTAAVIISTPVINIVFAAKKKFKPKTAAVINLLLKLLTIPMYILLCFAPIIAIVGSVWGLGIALAILVLTLAGSIISAVFSIPAAVSGARHGKIGRGAAFVIGFLSFIPAADIIVAIVLTTLSSKKAVTTQMPVQA